MTIRMQPPGFLDMILSLFGKKRAVFIPKQKMHYGYYIARRESFFRALFRPRTRRLAEGWVYWDSDEMKNVNKTL